MRLRGNLRSVSVCFVLCLLTGEAGFVTSTMVQAQATSASIHGIVADPTGALLAGATVTVTNGSTGISSVRKTDRDGYYMFPDLHIGGPYTVTIAAQGFRTRVVSGVVLDLSSEREIDGKLQVGAASQTVKVNSSAVQVETSDAQLKNVVGAAEIEELPLLGRDAVELQKTAPGVVESNDREGTFSTNGSQTQENSYLLDRTQSRPHETGLSHSSTSHPQSLRSCG